MGPSLISWEVCIPSRDLPPTRMPCLYSIRGMFQAWTNSGNLFPMFLMMMAKMMMTCNRKFNRGHSPQCLDLYNRVKSSSPLALNSQVSCVARSIIQRTSKQELVQRLLACLENCSRVLRRTTQQTSHLQTLCAAKFPIQASSKQELRQPMIVQKSRDLKQEGPRSLPWGKGQGSKWSHYIIITKYW